MSSLPPGAYVSVGVNPSARSAPTDTGVAHVAVLSNRAPANPSELKSINDWVGIRQSYSVSYDWADAFFRRGGNRMFAQAVVGPAAAAASVNIPGTSGTALTLTARDKGEWANGAAGGLTVEVTNGPSGDTTRAIIVFLNGVEIDRTPEYTVNQSAVDYFATTGSPANALLVAAAGGGSGLTPVTSVTNFTGGTIDRASITNTHLVTALAKLDSSNGPGQEACPDFQSDAAHDSLKASAKAHNRIAVPDPIDTKVKATLAASASHLFASTDSDYVFSTGPWTDIPPLAIGGTARAVPPSSLACAAFAIVDATPGDGPAQAPMGVKGIDRYGTAVRATFSRDTISGVNDAGDLNAVGMNLIIDDNGSIQIYGLRTGADPAGANAENSQIGVVRLRMLLTAEGIACGKPYVGRKITRTSLEGFETDLNALMLRHYDNGDVFGDVDDDRPQTAFRVDTDTPNTPETINAGTIGAIVTYRPVKGGEYVQIAFQAVAITDSVG